MSMTITDHRGLAVSGATPVALDLFEQALAELQLYRADPLATVEGAIAEAPAFAMAHALKAWLNLLGTEPGGVPDARAAALSAAAHAGTERERGHAAALGFLLDGRWHAAGRVLEDVTIAAPRDALALLAGHQIDFFTGAARMLRDRIARALPHWTSAELPNRETLSGMHAFGLEECGDYAAAEAAGRRAVAAEPRDGWAQHAVAHVLEMQCRTAEGIAWMEGNVAGWSGDSFLQVHNWWHLALYHLELGDHAAVLKLYDDHVYGRASGIVLEMVDASAMLWRLSLRGVDVGDRWRAVADGWQAAGGTAGYAFNDAHAVMAILGAGRRDAVAEVLAAQEAVADGRQGDNAAFTRDVGLPLCRGLVAFADGDMAKAASLLRAVRPIAHRFGGSHAQRDVIDLTLIEAALRGGDRDLAAALTAERAARRPESPFTRLLQRRAAELAEPVAA